MVDLLRHLTPLVPEASARILLLGWPRDTGDGWADELHGTDREVHQVEHETELDAGTTDFDIALWYGETSRDVTGAVSCLCRHLNDQGQLVVATPLPAGAEAAVSRQRQGSLPSRHQARLREIIKRLSEAGFAIRKDQDFFPEHTSGAAFTDGATGFKVLVARRDPFVVRSYRDGEEDAILRLFRASFHVDRSLDHWRWKYADGPWGKGKISLAEAASHSDRPAGEPGELAAHYGGYPIPIWYQDELGSRTFPALQIGDTMTDPAVRNSGRGKASLLARTVRHFFSVHRDGSHGFYYGFNTGPIQRFCRWFIGGSQDRAVRYLARDLEPAPEWRPGGYRIERIETMGPAWDRFFRRVAPSYRFLVRRDAQYLDWRYRQRPDASYVILAVKRFRRLVGWSVFLRRDDRIVWGDALFHPRHHRAAEPILAAALALPELAGARRIEAWFSGGPSGWNEQLAELGFTVQPEPQGLGLIALGDGEPEAFDRLGEMYTTMGDGDLF